MKIPKTIKIGPHVYAITYEKGFLENHNAYAQTRNSKTQIILDPDVSQSQLEESFIHEILHAIDNQILMFDRGKDEEPISRLAPRLLEVLKENNLLK